MRSKRGGGALLGIKGYPGRQGVAMSQRLGTERITTAVHWITEADVDFKGGVSYGGKDLDTDMDVTELTVVEILVARLARLETAPGAAKLLFVAQRGDPLHQAALLVGGLVLVDDTLGGGHVDALDGQAQGGLFVLGADGGDGVLRAGAQLGLDGLVTLAVHHVLLDCA